MLPAGFEPTIPASELAVDPRLGLAATGTGAIDIGENVFGVYSLLHCNVASSSGFKLRT